MGRTCTPASDVGGLLNDLFRSVDGHVVPNESSLASSRRYLLVITSLGQAFHPLFRKTGISKASLPGLRKEGLVSLLRPRLV
jgi:hypothetical protein